MTDEQYMNAQRRIYQLMSLSNMTPEQGAEFDRLLIAIEEYERLHYPIGEDEI
jgi:hypothetical protein